MAQPRIFALLAPPSSPQHNRSDDNNACDIDGFAPRATLALILTAALSPPLLVNLILFDPAEISSPLSRGDPRAKHMLDVLRRRVGETVEVGLIDGPRGIATVGAIHPLVLELIFSWGPPLALLPPITLLVGLARPQTARDVLRDATSLGATELRFIAGEKSESSYAQSTLWSSGEWRRHLILGAEQAFDTRLPKVTPAAPLADILAGIPRSVRRLALDNYEASAPLGKCDLFENTFPVLAIGPERGWSAREREMLRAGGFELVHLGPRVLRTETAVVAALSIVRAKLGLM